ncbi:hypothetical protein Moror_4587 [Moniliophthora roreri MCA 2997]|uniref:Uncharacterized protein n=1 Tax=Moniliophthora roreri (strain MCA 2997) TaxID=1381753 RepID=V2XF70_MONRO|nr:hypothetical protein Moror_4587 [Moniliophthora roreri MCA 2997]
MDQILPKRWNRQLGREAQDVLLFCARVTCKWRSSVCGIRIGAGNVVVKMRVPERISVMFEGAGRALVGELLIKLRHVFDMTFTKATSS